MNRSATRQYAILVLLLSWALLAQCTFVGFAFYQKATAANHIALPFTFRVYTRTVLHLDPTYGNSGLKIGDEILAINGIPIRGAQQIQQAQFAFHPGDVLTFVVRRSVNGEPRNVPVSIRTHSQANETSDWLTVIGLRTFLPLGCVLLGFYIAFARPLDPLAWITLGMLGSFAELLGREPVWAIGPPWRELLLVYFSVLNSIWPLWMVLFALYFPAPLQFLRNRRWIAWLVSVPFIALAIFNLYGDAMEGNHVTQIAGYAALSDRIENGLRILIIVYVSAFFGILHTKRHILKTLDEQRRLRVMIAGCTISLVPTLAVVFSEIGLLPAFPGWVVKACLLMLVFFPITLAYVIVVQRAMDVHMVIRAGVRYAIASTGLKVLRIALLAATAIATGALATRSGGRWEATLIAALGTTLIIGMRRLGFRLSHWMDRRFFREAYNAELVLTDLSNSVAGIRDKKTLIRTVAQRVCDSLHVERIAFLVQNGSFYEPAYALGFASNFPGVSFSRQAATVRLLDQSKSPSRVYFDDPQSWVHGTPEHEQSALRVLNAQLLLPVILKNRMLGIISLGPKRSEAPYSRGDLQLLTAVASQAGLALENAQLTETIRQEIAQRERMARELEIASEVQQKLFPQKLPQVQGLEFAGYCRPALRVGGDYYDFLSLPGGCFGMAVGDVAGKGIAGALLMASLQASLRGQTIKPSESLAEMIQNVNRLICEASTENRYATFFWCEYEPQTCTLRYVNAGHNPPIIYRARGSGEVIRLVEGGIVIGLFPDVPYLEAEVQLEPGDILVAFTDGITEAFDKSEAEFGEERLIEAIRGCSTRRATDAIMYILERVDAFTAGADQHDDMTLVIARVEGRPRAAS